MQRGTWCVQLSRRDSYDAYDLTFGEITPTEYVETARSEPLYSGWSHLYM